MGSTSDGEIEVAPASGVDDELIAAFVHQSGELSDLIPSYDNATLMVKNGCERCGGTGYAGRIAIHELMIGTPSIKRAIKKGQEVEELRRIALEEGMWTLKMDGISKIFNGQTDLENILKVCL